MAKATVMIVVVIVVNRIRLCDLHAIDGLNDRLGVGVGVGVVRTIGMACRVVGRIVRRNIASRHFALSLSFGFGRRFRITASRFTAGSFTAGSFSIGSFSAGSFTIGRFTVSRFTAGDSLARLANAALGTGFLRS